MIKMVENRFLTPAEVAEYTAGVAQTKASLSAAKMLLLGFMAGAFIAFASNGSTMAAHNLLLKPETYGMGRALTGVVFGTGLMMVVVAGAELFTGNNLMIIGVLEKKITCMAMLKNWLLVYVGNFLGSVTIAYLSVYSGLMSASANDFGAMTIRIAASKAGLNFWKAIVLGILCNILVCVAVWMSFSAKDIAGKLLACFFPIWLFVTSGFEHSIANMFYVPAGIWAASNPAWLEAAKLSESALAKLTWGNFLLNNLLPVTIGNIVGGGCLVGGVYWFCYLRKKA